MESWVKIIIGKATASTWLINPWPHGLFRLFPVFPGLRKLLEALETPVSGYASDAAIEVIDLNLAFPLTDLTDLTAEELELTPPQPLQPDSVAYMRLGG